MFQSGAEIVCLVLVRGWNRCLHGCSSMEGHHKEKSAIKARQEQMVQNG